MAAVLQTLKQRLAARADSEHEQALIRIAIFLGVMACLALGAVTGQVAAEVYVLSLELSAVGVGCGMLILAWIVVAPGRSDLRRVAGMLVDYGLMSTAMALKGEPLSWLYVLLMGIERTTEHHRQNIHRRLRRGTCRHHFRQTIAMMIIQLRDAGMQTTERFAMRWQHQCIGRQAGVFLE